ncbi:MAG: putative toxin-antitoxin system toxin component, PIN family [Elusimicrobia bacterium RBG_16_66_12]|nr:MAG: putative toxin-antitoxin system toxin component, PIN family [Elusimicrobia bacterium RBG_16_66_12]
MVKIVLDTNILVSAVISPEGPPARVLDMLADGPVQLIISPAISAEYLDVLSRKKFGLSEATARAMVSSLRKLAIEIVPSEPLRICTDREDDKFLECAAAAGAAYLVTGNLKHFPKVFGGVKIIGPAAFLREPAGIDTTG